MSFRSKGRIVEKGFDSVESAIDSTIRGVGKDKYTDLGCGVKVPSKDVIRGLQRLHEAKMPLFERLVQVVNILSFAVLIILVVKLT